MKDYQPILFPYAYNILGSAEDARDAVQDVLCKFFSGKFKNISNEKAYLIKAVINQSINIKDKKKKIRYGDGWLPEPIATEKTDNAVLLNDIASYALLILLEKLNPKERAVFILKVGFDYSHEEIAEVLSSTTENSRQLLRRARSKIDTNQENPGMEKPRQLLLQQFQQAVRDKDIPALEQLLMDDIEYSADGGGVIKVVAKHCSGIKEVIDLVLLVYTRFLSKADFVPTIINHQPALLYYRNKKLFLCQIFSFSSDGKIDQINSVLDPRKLNGLNI